MSSDSETSTLQKVTEAAEEFVEKMTDTESPPNESTETKSEGKMTLEERKVKMQQLRKKLVGRPLCFLWSCPFTDHFHSVRLSKPTEQLL